MKFYLLLLAVVTVSACAGIFLKDCGDDKQCLDASFKECSGAKGTFPFSKNYTAYLEIRGLENDRCVVYEKVEGPGIDQVLQAINNRTGKSYNELYLLCKLPRNVTNLEMDLEPADIKDYCEGSFLDLLTPVFLDLFTGISPKIK